jgi:hypothetical protein
MFPGNKNAAAPQTLKIGKKGKAELNWQISTTPAEIYRDSMQNMSLD